MSVKIVDMIATCMPAAKMVLDLIIAGVRRATLAMEDRVQVNFDSFNVIK